jgi:hypothetical protein
LFAPPAMPGDRRLMVSPSATGAMGISPRRATRSDAAPPRQSSTRGCGEPTRRRSSPHGTHPRFRLPVGAAVPLAGGLGLSGYGWWSPRSTSPESSPSDLAHAHHQPPLHPRPGRLGQLRYASDGPALKAAPARFDEVASTRSDEAERDLVTGGGRVVDEGDLAGGAAIAARTAGNSEMAGSDDVKSPRNWTVRSPLSTEFVATH